MMNLTDKTNIPPGTAALIEGRLIIADAEEWQNPLISAGKNVTVKVDGKEISDEVRVSKENLVEIIPKKVSPEVKFLLKVSNDRLKATLVVQRKNCKQFILEDIPAAKELHIETKKYKEIEPPSPSKEELLDFLKNEGVVYGVHEEALDNLAENLISEAVVATGTPPEKGVDARIELLFKKNNKEVENEAKQSIISERFIAMVEEGDDLAIKIPSQPGKPGQDVYGKSIAPPPAKDISLIACKGAKLVEDGTKVVAEISGRVEVNNNRISVFPIYLVEGDAAAQEGHIKFNGDVIVKGNVLDGMKIKAKGNIEVTGFAANSELTADKNITVHKSLVGCTVKAGGNALLYRQIKNQLQGMLEQILELVTALKQFKKTTQKSGKEVKDGALLKLLLEKKFTGIPSLITSSLKLLNKISLEFEGDFNKKLEETIVIVKSWQRKTVGLGPLEINSIGDLEYMLRSLNTSSQKLLKLLNEGSEDAYITCGYVQNCVLEASGGINITGKGCYNSQLVSVGSVEIMGIPGVFRGGSITAMGNVKIRELGSDAETKSFIQVNKESVVMADVVYPGTTIKSGPYIKKITEKEYNYKLYGST